MDPDTALVISIWTQSAVAIAAVAAAIIALAVSHKERATMRTIAAEDRIAALEQAKLMFDLDVLLRLSHNIERAGHVDPTISKDMGAEARALLNVLGPDRLPQTWEDKRKNTLAEACEYAQREDTPAYKRHAIEVHLELDRVARRIEQLVQTR